MIMEFSRPGRVLSWVVLEEVVELVISCWVTFMDLFVAVWLLSVMVRSADDDKEHSAEVGLCCVAGWMVAEVPYSRLSQP